MKDVDGEVLEGILSRLLGIVIPDVNAPVGLGCQPLSVNEAEGDSWFDYVSSFLSYIDASDVVISKLPAALIISSVSGQS